MVSYGILEVINTGFSIVFVVNYVGKIWIFKRW
jgi:hypothetical protein